VTAFDDLLPALDARFERLREESKIPGVAWGVVRDGALVHAAGAGTIRDGEDRRPDADSVYRIASMTKSFTATALLLLRDEGRLGLDDPVADHVPALAGWRPPTPDAPPITIRQLMTMSAGLATDDPWGDRQQGLPLDAFERLLAEGPPFTWPPGTVFEYSNLGYGILGRVITAVAGVEYREFVRDRILVPMGMTSTAYLAEDVPAERLAGGYMRRDDELTREGDDPYGALASMGGVFSTVRDLARWVSGFVDAFPARDDPEGDHPLRRSSRREMQQIHRSIPPYLPARPAHEAPVAMVGGYGYGLVVMSDTELGTVIQHSGGYPGFGAHMTWHPATGIGLIGLGNLRYAPCRPVVDEQLRVLVLADAVPRRRVQPGSAVRAFRPAMEGLLVAWDDAVADAAFAMNMDLDEPREVRRAAVEKVAADLGPFRPDPTRPEVSESPAHVTWWLRGERGWVRLALLVTPEPSPRVQRFAVTAVPDPSDALLAIADRILAAAASPSPAWPAGVVAGPDLDVVLIERSMRAAAARFGTMRRGLAIAGDGTTTATIQVDGDDGRAELKIAVEAATGAVTALVLSAAEREAAAEAW
jgi:CubicO group peptidase (beta-lactamase class C family)